MKLDILFFHTKMAWTYFGTWHIWSDISAWTYLHWNISAWGLLATWMFCFCGYFGMKAFWQLDISAWGHHGTGWFWHYVPVPKCPCAKCPCAEKSLCWNVNVPNSLLTKNAPGDELFKYMLKCPRDEISVPKCLLPKCPSPYKNSTLLIFYASLLLRILWCIWKTFYTFKWKKQTKETWTCHWKLSFFCH